MKKLPVLIITVLLGCLFLFGCSSSSSSSSSNAELDPAETIIGTWESEPVDTTNDAADNNSDISEISVVYRMTFADDNTYTIESVSTETKTDGTSEDITSESEGEYLLDSDALTLEGNDPENVTVTFSSEDTMVLTGEGLGTDDSLTLTRVDTTTSETASK